MFFNGDPDRQALLIAAACLIAYFIGSISPSTMMARSRGIDIKAEGSGNAGTTNALRVMGRKAGAVTMTVDIAKGAAAVLIGMLLGGDTGMTAAALCVTAGHIWPVIYRFKGGKGVATVFGALLVLNWKLALTALAIVAAGVLLSKRMSVGSLAGIITLPFAAWLLEPGFTAAGTVLAAVLLVKHRGNIARILKGQEPKLSIFDKEGDR